MGFFDKLRGELIDIIEWTDPSSDTMVWRFPRYNNEIKMGAKLVVRESQKAVFVNQGRIADLFEPGLYTLDTDNLPVLSTLLGWMHGFNSPFKAEVYFINTRRFTDLKWGTKHPITLRDREFGPVRLRAFGTYTVRVSDPERFLREIVGTDGHFTTDQITDQLRNMMVARFADLVGESNIPVLDLAGNYDELGQFISKRIGPEFDQYGLELNTLLVENISLPPEVEKVLDKRTGMGIIGDMNQYTRMQMADAMPLAAENPGGVAAGGMGMGMGFAMAGQMAQTLGGQPGQSGGAVPPPLPGQAPVWYLAIDNRQSGPFDINALKQQAQSGQLKPDTLVWKQGMAQWMPAGQLAELKELLGTVPPPLP